MPDVSWTGVDSIAVCQPLAVSPTKVTWASRVPVDDHSEPLWVPVLPTPL